LAPEAKMPHLRGNAFYQSQGVAMGKDESSFNVVTFAVLLTILFFIAFMVGFQLIQKKASPDTFTPDYNSPLRIVET
jgi:hypothetical protein